MSFYTRDELVKQQVFSNVIEDYEKHDKSCKGLEHVWLGRKGGFTAFGDIFVCDGCDMNFYNDALGWDEEADDTDYRCECCRRGK